MNVFAVASPKELLQGVDRLEAWELFALAILRGEPIVSLFEGYPCAWRFALGAEWDATQSAELEPDVSCWSIAIRQIDGPKIVVATKDRSPLAGTFALQSLVSMLTCYPVTEVWLYWQCGGMSDAETLITIYKIDRGEGG